MKRFLMPYWQTDSYFSQIEGSAYVNLRFAFTCLGIACWPMRGRTCDQTWLQRLMPLFSLAIWQHTAQCDQRWVVRLVLFGTLVFGYRTRGDAEPWMATYSERGLYLFSRKSLARRLAAS